MEHFEDLSTIAEASVMELKEVKGISVAKAETIQVAFEISRRLTQTKTTRSPTVTNPHGIYCLLQSLFGSKEELPETFLGVLNLINNVPATVCYPSSGLQILKPATLYQAT